MVEYHIQIDLYPVLVEHPYQVFKFIALPVVLCTGRVAGIGRKKAYGVVSPVIIKLTAVHLPVILHLVEFKYGHQLHHVHTQLQQIGKLFHQSLKGSRMKYG